MSTPASHTKCWSAAIHDFRDIAAAAGGAAAWCFELSSLQVAGRLAPQVPTHLILAISLVVLACVAILGVQHRMEPSGGEHCAGRPDATSVAGAAKKHKVSEQTIYAWRKHFGELAPSDLKRLRTLEAENVRLTRLLAELDLDISVLKEIDAPAASSACRARA